MFWRKKCDDESAELQRKLEAQADSTGRAFEAFMEAIHSDRNRYVVKKLKPARMNGAHKGT